MTDPLKQLSDAGVAVWLDDLSRERLVTGNLANLIRDRHVVGETTNPTIFQKAISGSSFYNEQVKDLAIRGIDVNEALRAITAHDVRTACDLFKPAYEASGGQDGRVSIEVSPELAHNTEATIAEARSLWWLVDRPNLFIKIPATKAGIPAIEQVLAEGISVNVTLIFSLERYGEVINAFLSGLERARVAGHDVSKMASVASFFVSRVDSEVDARLEKIGSTEAKDLKGKAAIANARLAFKLFEDQFDSDEWRALESVGAKPQRPLWASTSTKDPSYDDTMYVVDLVAAGTVNTMPEATIEAVADHGVITGDTIRPNYNDAQNVIDQLEALGISYNDVVDVLEKEGVEKFEASWSELVESTKAELERLGAK